MADDWAAFSPQPNPGEPSDAWAAFNPQAAATSTPDIGGALPEAFVNRVAAGSSLSRVFQAAGKGMVEGFGPSTPTGMPDEWLNFFIHSGIFHDPSRQQAGPIQLTNEAIITPVAQAVAGLARATSAGIHGAAEALGQAVREYGDRQAGLFTSGSPDRARDETINAGNWFLIEAGLGRFARLRPDGAETIGGLPRAEDFTNTATALHTEGGATVPEIEAHLRTLWEERGIHPAEAFVDASNDAFLKHDATAPSAAAPEKPEGLTPEEYEVLGKPASLGADITTNPPLIPPAEQPLTPPGTLTAVARDAIDKFNGLGKNVQFMLDPMATGSNRAMVVAKDAMNSIRRIRWDHSRLDADIANRFSPEQREFMWIAADEESVLRQTGEASTDTGLLTLGPEERAAVEAMHERAQSAWLHARDAGIVEGEGLPAYTPRMVLNVANLGENVAPQALNELGRNVFTRTSQILHRKNLTAEETEEAAKQLVGSRMAERGASIDEIKAAVDKVTIAKDIRALPLATSRLEQAAVWRGMINKIEEMGKATGEPTVAVGYKPDNSWFTIAGNPAFTKWEPMLERNPVTGKWGARSDDGGNVIFQPKPIYMPPEFRGPMTAILDESASNNKAVRGAMSAYDALMAIKGKAMTAILNSPLIHNEVVWSKVMEAAGGRDWLGFGLYFRGNKIVNGAVEAKSTGSNFAGRAQELIERGLNPMGPRGSIQDITGVMEEPNLQPGRSLTAKVIAYIPGLYDQAKGNAVKAAIDKAGDFWHNTLLWDRVRDVQFGLADHLSDSIVAKGVDRMTADRVAAHFSNIIVGSIPKEAMSAAARATANMLLFSRSFTLGNLSTFKQAALGLPKPILAQIERDTGMSIPAQGASKLIPAAFRSGPTGIAARKAVSTVVLSAGLYYVGNALIQHGINMALRDATLADELQGYARRYKALMDDVKGGDYFELRHLVSRLSPTYDNEPRKQDRALLGYEANGTAIYVRNPTGKFGEEMVGYPTAPMEMLRRKLSPMAAGLLDILENDAGFGRKIYNENDKTIGGDLATAFAVAKHLVMRHLPESQIGAGLDLLRGDGDKTVNTLRLVGPALGFTASEGAPGGPARGEQLAVKQDADVRFNLQWPDIKKQILRGDEDGARAAMNGLGLSVREQVSLMRAARNPNSVLKGHTLQNFMRHATPEQRERFDRARGQ